MKEETKELVQWIIARLNKLRTEALDSGTEISDLPPQYEQAFAFLDSLPEIESHLCRGGYIQDKDGKPCCDGDQIINPSLLDGKKELGTLYWSKSDCRFYFKKEDKCHSLAVGYNGFEKVVE